MHYICKLKEKNSMHKKFKDLTVKNIEIGGIVVRAFIGGRSLDIKIELSEEEKGIVKNFFLKRYSVYQKWSALLPDNMIIPDNKQKVTNPKVKNNNLYDEIIAYNAIYEKDTDKRIRINLQAISAEKLIYYLKIAKDIFLNKDEEENLGTYDYLINFIKINKERDMKLVLLNYFFESYSFNMNICLLEDNLLYIFVVFQNPGNYVAALNMDSTLKEINKKYGTLIWQNEVMKIDISNKFELELKNVVNYDDKKIRDYEFRIALLKGLSIAALMESKEAIKQIILSGFEEGREENIKAERSINAFGEYYMEDKGCEFSLIKEKFFVYEPYDKLNKIRSAVRYILDKYLEANKHLICEIIKERKKLAYNNVSNIIQIGSIKEKEKERASLILVFTNQENVKQVAYVRIKLDISKNEILETLYRMYIEDEISSFFHNVIDYMDTLMMFSSCHEK